MNVSIINNKINKSLIFDNNTYILYSFISDDLTVNHNTSQTIKQIGEYITSSAVTSRAISIIGYLIGNSQQELKQLKEELLNIINPLQELTLKVGEKTITVKAVNGVQWATKWENNNNNFVKFNLSFIAPGTLWEDLEYNIVNFTPWENKLIFPAAIPSNGMIFGTRSRTKFTSIYNNSNVNLGLIIKMNCLSEIINPCIINITTGEKLKLKMVLQPSDTITINTAFNSKSITINGTNGIKCFDFSVSSWLMLASGENTFTYKTDNNSENALNIQLMYKNNYWGIS